MLAAEGIQLPYREVVLGNAQLLFQAMLVRELVTAGTLTPREPWRHCTALHVRVTCAPSNLAVSGSPVGEFYETTHFLRVGVLQRCQKYLIEYNMQRIVEFCLSSTVRN